MYTENLRPLLSSANSFHLSSEMSSDRWYLPGGPMSDVGMRQRRLLEMRVQ